MKKLILLFAIVITATTVALISCTDEYEETNSLDTVEQELYAKYAESSEKPIVSMLDLALGKASISRSGDYILGFTEEDVTYLNSLDEKGLRDLKSQLMTKWGIESDEDVENILDQAYDEICESMTDEELVKINNFITEYIEMPAGIESLEQLGIFDSNQNSNTYINTCIQAAISIDNFGRPLYDSLYKTRASAEDCKKIFATRIAITSVSTMAGMMLPGPGWIVTAMAVCDAAGAAADYYNCMNS